MKTVLLIVESLEPGNLHRGFYNGLLHNESESLNVIPLVFPRDVKFNWTIYDELILHAIEKNKIDIFFVIDGEQISIETLKKLQLKKIKLITWQIDDPFMLTECHGSENRKKFPLYDVIYTTNKASVESHYKKLGLYDKVSYLSFGYDPMFHKNLNLDKIYEVSFVGSDFSTRREKYINKLLHQVNIWGFLPSTRISHYEMIKVVNQSKINLNFSDQPVNGVKCFKNRVLEVLGCEQFLLTETFLELEEMFVPGKELDCFSSTEEMNDKISFYLKNDTLRGKIAKSGAKKVRKYQYKKIISSIIKDF